MKKEVLTHRPMNNRKRASVSPIFQANNAPISFSPPHKQSISHHRGSLCMDSSYRPENVVEHQHHRRRSLTYLSTYQDDMEQYMKEESVGHLCSPQRTHSHTMLKNRRKSVDFNDDAYEYMPSPTNKIPSRISVLFGDADERNTSPTSAATSIGEGHKHQNNHMPPRRQQLERIRTISGNFLATPLFHLNDAMMRDEEEAELNYLQLGLPEFYDGQEGHTHRAPKGDFLSDKAIFNSVETLYKWDPAALSAKFNLLSPGMGGHLVLEGQWALLDYFNAMVEGWLLNCYKKKIPRRVVFPSRVPHGFMEYVIRYWRPEEFGHQRRFVSTTPALRLFNGLMAHPLPESRPNRQMIATLWRMLLWIAPDLYSFSKILDEVDTTSNAPPQVQFRVDLLNPGTKSTFISAPTRKVFTDRRRLILRRLILLQLVHQRDYLYSCLSSRDPSNKRLDRCIPQNPLDYKWNDYFICLLRASIWSSDWNHTLNPDPSKRIGKTLFERYPAEYRGAFIQSSVEPMPPAWPQGPDDMLMRHIQTKHLATSIHKPQANSLDDNPLELFRFDPLGFIRRYFERDQQKSLSLLADASTGAEPTEGSRADLSQSPRQITSLPAPPSPGRGTLTPKRLPRSTSRSRAGTAGSNRCLTPVKKRLFDEARLKKQREIAEREVLERWHQLTMKRYACDAAKKLYPQINAIWMKQSDSSVKIPIKDLIKYLERSPVDGLESTSDIGLMQSMAIEMLVECGVECRLLYVVRGAIDSFLCRDKSGLSIGIKNATTLLLRRRDHICKALELEEEALVAKYYVPTE